ncbi:hypothetical protein BDV93DRAFT_609342 [Ceratobasidium sp. AG-I]|nr:hypothetical protein BDV93DRAFT_609342 [Ceratobasidium sp. AG-I]
MSTVQVTSLDHLTPRSATSSLMIAVPIEDALQQWKAARAALANTIQTYIDTCSKLEISCLQVSESKGRSTPRLLEVCKTLDDELSSLAFHEAALLSARMKLQRHRNMSETLSPISRLPAEILAHIFTLAVNLGRNIHLRLGHPKPSLDQVHIIASVCSQWRQITLITGPLWAHLDLGKICHLNHATLWLERARGQPLDICVRPTKHYHSDKSKATFARILPLINHLGSFALHLDVETAERWFSAWSGHGVPGALTALALQPTRGKPLMFPPNPQTVSQERLGELFSSLNTLFLCNMRVDWDYTVFRNLITLNLTDIKSGPTINALAQILLNSPRLECLQLSNMDIWSTSKAAPQQIRLNYLQTLELSFLNSEILLFFLTMLVLGDSDLTIKLGLLRRADGAFKKELSAFCKRSNIKTFYCLGDELLLDLVDTMPNLEVLILRESALDSNFCNIVAPPPKDDNESSKRITTYWPKLHTLHAIGCHLTDLTGFKRLLAACPIRELRVSSSSSVGSGSASFKSWIGPGVDFGLECRNWSVGFEPFVNL